MYKHKQRRKCNKVKYIDTVTHCIPKYTGCALFVAGGQIYAGIVLGTYAHIIKCRKCFELTGPDDRFPFCSSRATDDVAIRPSTNVPMTACPA